MYIGNRSIWYFVTYCAFAPVRLTCVMTTRNRSITSCNIILCYVKASSSIRPQHIHSIRQHNPFLINGVKSHCRQPLAAVLSVPPACSYGSNYSCIAAAAAYAPSPSTGAELTRRIASKPAACTFRHFAFGSCGIVNASLSAFPCGYPEPGLVK